MGPLAAKGLFGTIDVIRVHLSFIVLALACAGVAVAQNPVVGSGTTDVQILRPWVASTHYVHDVVSDDRDDWDHGTVVAGRRFSRGALLLEGGWAARYGLTAMSLGVDAYGDLWARGQVNVRYLHSPDGVIVPTNDFSAQLSQVVGGGVELSGAYHLREYSVQTVNAAAAQIGLYIGSWYLRSRTSILPHSGEVGVMQHLSARHFWASRYDFVEVSASAGRGVELVDSDALLVLTRVYSVSARAQRMLTSNLGLSVLVGYSDDDFYRRTTLGAGITAIW